MTKKSLQKLIYLENEKSFLDEIKRVEVAKTCFGKIKRRYPAKRLELKKVDKSGPPLQWSKN